MKCLITTSNKASAEKVYTEYGLIVIPPAEMFKILVRPYQNILKEEARKRKKLFLRLVGPGGVRNIKLRPTTDYADISKFISQPFSNEQKQGFYFIYALYEHPKKPSKDFRYSLAFVFDIDIEIDEKLKGVHREIAKKEAIKSIIQSLEGAGLAADFLVSTGNGIHLVYQTPNSRISTRTPAYHLHRELGAMIEKEILRIPIRCHETSIKHVRFKVDRLPLTQGFRFPGSPTKDGNGTAVCMLWAPGAGELLLEPESTMVRLVTNIKEVEGKEVHNRRGGAGCKMASKGETPSLAPEKGKRKWLSPDTVEYALKHRSIYLKAKREAAAAMEELETKALTPTQTTEILCGFIKEHARIGERNNRMFGVCMLLVGMGWPKEEIEKALDEIYEVIP